MNNVNMASMAAQRPRLAMYEASTSRRCAAAPLRGLSEYPGGLEKARPSKAFPGDRGMSVESIELKAVPL